MARVAVIGEPARLLGWAAAGALACPASDPEDIRQAANRLPADVDVVVLTRLAAEVLHGEQWKRLDMCVVLP